jgi:hypothetical protein
VLGAAALVVLCLLGSATRWNRTRIWSTAAQDAPRIVAAIKAKMPSPPLVVYLGPTPVVRDNIAAFADDSNLFGALQLAYDQPDLEAHVLHDQAAFDAAPEAARLDPRSVSELETVKLIELVLGVDP